MGASRKLQGEIDRVLKKVQEGVDVFDSIWNKVYDTDNANQKEKFEADLKKEIKKLQRYRDQIKTWIQSSEIKDKKVSASYEQALVDARKQIEREMERFKICEKETKTKAFSKEGLGLQPKTDPKEKAKSETRDWINNLVAELESQIDNFEAELEGLSVKKGKARPPRLIHLETSISRHKAHIMKLELILRLLDNDELSPEQVNDVKEFLEDYIERNQEDFDEFSDVDEFYSSLPLEKVEALEDLVTMGPPGLVKVGAASLALSLKTSVTQAVSQALDTFTSPPPTAAVQEHNEPATSQETNSDLGSRTPTPKGNEVGSSNLPSVAGSHSALVTASVLSHLPGTSIASTAAHVAASSQDVLESPVSAIPTTPNISSVVKEDETTDFPGRKSSPALSDGGLVRGISRGGISSQTVTSNPLSPGPTVLSSGVMLGSVPSASEVAKRSILGADDRLANNVVGTRAFSSVPGMQWRPGSSVQNQNDVGQIRGRTEIPPDQREKFLQKLQQVQQQQTHNNLLGIAGGNHKQFSGQQNPLMQQLSSQSASASSHVGLGVPAPGIITPTSVSLHQQPGSIYQQAPQPGSLLNATVEEQQQQISTDDSTAEVTVSGLTKNLMNEDDLKASYVKDLPIGGASGPSIDSNELQLDTDLSPGQLLHSNQPSGGLGVIGRRSASDLGAIGDNLCASSPNSAPAPDPRYILQMLESAYYKLPQPKDSERSRVYIPKKPAITPASYPQFQAPIVNHPAFWERLGVDTMGTDALFFAFYYQPNTYQQYLAAKELKKQSWRFHRKFNTWFQRHEEPKVATDEFEKGTYVYFDFHVSNDDLQHGWCQRIKHDFTFEYNYLEDELIV